MVKSSEFQNRSAHVRKCCCHRHRRGKSNFRDVDNNATMGDNYYYCITTYT